MKHLVDYSVYSSLEGIPLFVTGIIGLVPDIPVLVYDGGDQAILFRSEKECNDALMLALTGRKPVLSDNNVFLLELIPDETQKILPVCGWALFMEKKPEEDEVINDYKVKIRFIRQGIISALN